MADERTGIQRIADERARQIAKLGWTVEHDDGHGDCAIAIVAACYAAAAARTRIYAQGEGNDYVRFYDPFPWDNDARPRKLGLLTEPSDTESLRLLEKAGALIAAEIDRLVRKAAR